jgi:hypothetical protein
LTSCGADPLEESAPDEGVHGLCEAAPEGARGEDDHGAIENSGAAEDVAEAAEEGLCDGESDEVGGGDPVLVREVVELGADDVHGGRGGGFVEVGRCAG